MSRGRFDVWAPERDRVRLVVQPVPEEGRSPVSKGTLDMTRGDDGWWTPDAAVPATTDGAEVDYGYLLDDATDPRPDPRSRRQPQGVHALSRTWDPASHDWQDGSWTGRQLAGSVVYELHVGTFSPDGTLDGAIAKLPHLVDLGVDLVELLPVNAFDGDRGWGYDGVQWYAVHEAYGGPAAYARFVDACHAHGLGVVQDVVYNHLGPSGNYLPEFGPYLHATGQNSWGSSLNLDGEHSDHVRRYIVDNALMWLRDLHVDALRLDAVHALADTSITHLLEQLATEVDALSAHLRRPLTLIAESDLNDTRMVTPREAGGRGIHAQWSDDFHHAVHVALTGETSGYYGDFEPLSALAKVCERGFLHDGTFSTFRGRPHGRPVDTAAMPTWRLVVCNQNHDQVGNRATGDRLAATLDDDQLVCAALLTLCGPFTPMLWQGEEWASSSPFQFFTGFTDEDLAEAVRTGRRSEFASHGWGEQEVPDPQDPETFRRSRLDWDELASGRHAVVLDAYRRLGGLRRSLHSLTDPSFGSVRATADEESRVFTLRRGSTMLAVNFGSSPASVDATGSIVFTTPTAASLASGVLTLPAHAGALVVD